MHGDAMAGAGADDFGSFDGDLKIGVPNGSERDRIREIYLASFDEGERETVADLATDLLAECLHPRPIHLVAYARGDLVGHVCFSAVRQRGSQAPLGSILAPLAVAPAWQKRGVGSALVKEGLSRPEIRAGGLVFVYGDPEYYHRFGFSRQMAERFRPPCSLTFPSGWQAVQLGEKGLPEEPVVIECVGPLAAPEIW